ncbi:MAG: ABC transporter permease [Candidatus Diapherotrites archaeon]
MPDFEIFAVALRNLRYQGLRSYLTLLGVIIGIAAIVALLSISNGFTASISNEIESLGSNTIFLIPLATQTGISSAENLQLRDPDLSRIESFTGVSAVIPLYSTRMTVERGTEKITATILAGDPDKTAELSDSGYNQIADGRDLQESDVFSVVIGYDFANNAFSRALSNKTSLTIDEKKFRVVGILEESSTSIGGGPNFNNSIVMTEKAFKQISSVTSPAIVFIKTFSPEDVNSVQERTQRYFDRKFGEGNFLVQSSTQILEAVNSILGLVSLFLLGIAAISLVVGGVGIMNSMVTAALERTREIGIMKAVGATENTIMGLFLIEAGMIGLVGGIIGLGLGYFASLLVAAIAQSANFSLTADLPIELALGVLAFAMVVGMVSGLYPARRAAKLDPVEALRYE